MGKTTLLRAFRDEAEGHERLDCTTETFELGGTDDPNTFLDKLLHETFGLTRANDGRSRLAGPKWKKQVSALFGVVKADKLFESLLGESWQPDWAKVLKLFESLSNKMKAERRVIFFIDANKYLRGDSGKAWLPVINNLPPKFMLVFAQRPEDAVAANRDVTGPSVRRIPSEDLAELPPDDAAEYIEEELKRIGKLTPEARKVLKGYSGWPYAINAGLLLLGDGVPAAELPRGAGDLFQSLLEKLGDHGAEALDLVNALAILEVAVPIDVLAGFVDKRVTEVQALLTDPFIGGLVRRQQKGHELFHALFADAVRSQILDNRQKKTLHQRVVQLYEARLESNEKDELALRRLATHVREANGDDAWVLMVDRLFRQKYRLGMIAECVAELEDAVCYTSLKEHRAVLFGNLGILYKTLGNLDTAEEMYGKSLAISEELGHKEGMAKQYGNLGILYDIRGNVDAAEDMHRKGLSIDEELGRKEGMASDYGNLGNLSLTRGDLDTAEEMFSKSLAIDEELGRKEGICAKPESTEGH